MFARIPAFLKADLCHFQRHQLLQRFHERVVKSDGER